MSDSTGRWLNTTHDWATSVDRGHLNLIRRHPDRYAPGGVLHLVLEVLAYADDEAEALGRRGHALVTFSDGGAVEVADDGRGTETRRAPDGRIVKKPVMASKDLRFFDANHESLLPDGHHRRGISVVAALSDWLVHTNRRQNRAWTQRHEHGLPTTGLTPVDTVHATGTTVRFLPDHHLLPGTAITVDDVRGAARFPWLVVQVQQNDTN